jgi:hypothetical protein
LEVFAKSLRIVLELNQIEHIRVFSAQKAASSHHHRDREKYPGLNAMLSDSVSSHKCALEKPQAPAGQELSPQDPQDNATRFTPWH